MAHFAQLDENNMVLQLIVVHNNELLDNGVESEAKGIAFCQSLFPNTRWAQTSYNANFRKNYAGIGFVYDADLDGFIPPKPYPSWVLSAENCNWQPPVPYPSDGNPYYWDEASLAWIPLLSTEPSTEPTVL
jgi:hypothetical protein